LQYLHDPKLYFPDKEDTVWLFTSIFIKLPIKVILAFSNSLLNHVYSIRKCTLKLSDKEKKEIFFLSKNKPKQKDYKILTQYFFIFLRFFYFFELYFKTKNSI